MWQHDQSPIAHIYSCQLWQEFDQTSMDHCFTHLSLCRTVMDCWPVQVYTPLVRWLQGSSDPEQDVAGVENGCSDGFGTVCYLKKKKSKVKVGYLSSMCSLFNLSKFINTDMHKVNKHLNFFIYFKLSDLNSDKYDNIGVKTAFLSMYLVKFWIRCRWKNVVLKRAYLWHQKYSGRATSSMLRFIPKHPALSFFLFELESGSEMYD